jgi:cytochrome c oxidase cbb3-type subunit 4
MISGIFTLAALIGFTGVTWWAYTRRNRARFDEAARLPLTEELQRTAPPASAELPPCCRENRP